LLDKSHFLRTPSKKVSRVTKEGLNPLISLGDKKKGKK